MSSPSHWMRVTLITVFMGLQYERSRNAIAEHLFVTVCNERQLRTDVGNQNLRPYFPTEPPRQD